MKHGMIATLKISLLLVLTAGCGDKLGERQDTLNDYLDPRAERVRSMTSTIMTGGPDHKPPHPGPRPAVTSPRPGFSLTRDNYSSCDELQEYMRRRLAERRAEETRYREWQRKMYEYEDARAGSAQKASAAPDVSPETDENMASDTSAPGEGAGDAGTDSESFTNLQENGVDEADRFKIGTHHIYALSGKNIQVTDRKSLALLGSIAVADLSHVTLYTDAERLVVTGEVITVRQETFRECSWTQSTDQQDSGNNEVHAATPDASSEGYVQNCHDKVHEVLEPTGMTAIRIYSTSAGQMPVLVSEKLLKGSTIETRMIGGRLVVVLRGFLMFNDPAFSSWGDEYAYTYSGWPYELSYPEAPPADNPVILDAAGTVDGIPCNQIVRKGIEDFDFRLTRIISLNVRAPDEPMRSTAILGGGDHVYMTTENLYVTKQSLEWYGWDTDENGLSWWNSSDYQKLVITQIAYDAKTGILRPVASGLIDGYVKDQWAFKEFAGQKALVVATSTGNFWSGQESEPSNHLVVLKSDPAAGVMNKVAEIRDYGRRENIRAIRYVGTTAYVVTFRNTDPLFAFDLSDVTRPRALGELKIPGFSTYLHPVAPGLLAGVGFDAEESDDFAMIKGVQVSLFDVREGGQMQRLDVKIHGDRGSYSEINTDHHAFTFDAETMTMVIPVVELGSPVETEYSYDIPLQFSGAVIYTITDGRLVETDRVSHQDLMPAACREGLRQNRWWTDQRASPDINRMLKVDGRWLSLSRFGIKAHDGGNPSEILQSVAFPDTDTICRSDLYGVMMVE